jgi:predicted transcriptional regulator
MIGGEVDIEHTSRKQIYNYIHSNPGLAFKDIQHFFQMNASTLKYHLDYLEKSKKIISKREGRNRCYYCQQRSGLEYNDRDNLKPRSLTKIQRYILELIKAHPGITNKDLIFRTRLKRQGLNYNIKKLTDLKIIWVINNDGNIGYEYITKDKLRSQAINRLILKLVSDEITEEQYLKIKKKLETMDIDEYFE